MLKSQVLLKHRDIFSLCRYMVFSCCLRPIYCAIQEKRKKSATGLFFSFFPWQRHILPIECHEVVNSVIKCHSSRRWLMFRGRSKHNLDSKGRLVIPARFKEFLEQKNEECLVVTNHDTGEDTCLWAYPRMSGGRSKKRLQNSPNSIVLLTTTSGILSQGRLSVL